MSYHFFFEFFFRLSLNQKFSNNYKKFINFFLSFFKLFNWKIAQIFDEQIFFFVKRKNCLNWFSIVFAMTELLFSICRFVICQWLISKKNTMFYECFLIIAFYIFCFILFALCCEIEWYLWNFRRVNDEIYKII